MVWERASNKYCVILAWTSVKLAMQSRVLCHYLWLCVLAIVPCLVLASSSGLIITNSSGATCRLENAHSFDGTTNTSCSSCRGVYVACRQLLVATVHPVSPVESSLEADNATSDTIKPPSKAEAYGYGFLLSIAVSGTSLLALFLVPCMKPGAKLYFLYKPINALMMGSASFALLADAVLHILPELYGDSEDTNSTTTTTSNADPNIHTWRVCLLIAAVYVFFVLEFFMHAMSSKAIGSHGHSHDHAPTNSQEVHTATNDTSDHKPPPTDQFGLSQIENGEVKMKEGGKPTSDDPKVEVHHKYSRWNVCRFKPLVWLLITGDSIHNFTDGVALGAAIASSLSLGISTAIAIVLHEIPHELGDFAILLSTGMNWYTAFLLNFLHGLTAIVGFFVGVAIGTNSEVAVNWILTATLGIFLYISLVDLLPTIIHNTEKGYMLAVIFIMANIGIAISVISLLLIAIYEEELDNLVH